MADDFEDRRKRDLRRSEEDEKDADLKRPPGAAHPLARGPVPPGGRPAPTDAGPADTIDRLLERAEPAIEQLNNLYNQFLAGVERVPPVAQRKNLDETMATLQVMPKPTPALRFRFDTLNAKYLAHRERWDRLLRDRESGGRARRQ